MIKDKSKNNCNYNLLRSTQDKKNVNCDIKDKTCGAVLKCRDKDAHCGTFIQHRIRSYSQGNQARKRNQRQPNQKVKLSPFAGDMMSSTENPRDSTKKLLE